MGKTVKVIHVVRSLRAGGIVSFILNVYKQISCKDIQFDFIVEENNMGIYGKEIQELGGNIFFINDVSNDIVGILAKLKRIDRIIKRNGPYDVFHAHYYFANPYLCLIAAINRIPKRISHSHNTRVHGVGMKKRCFETMSRLLFKIVCTDLVGCSNTAAHFLYGDTAVRRGKTKTIYNGVDLNRFTGNHLDSKAIRGRYGISADKKVISFVGRLERQKNPLFLIDIISNLLSVRNDITLIIVGEGTYEAAVGEVVTERGLEDVVKILPPYTDIPEILSCTDIFVLPSLFEGLPVVLLEAQASKLRCVVSSNVSDEVDAGYCTFIELNNGAKCWADEIAKMLGSTSVLEQQNYNSRMNKFNIVNTAKNILQLYNLESFESGGI